MLRGGVTVRIRGSAFKEGTQVFFAGRVSRTVTVVSSGELLAVTPPGAELGPVDVEIRSGGESFTILDAFRYTENLPEINIADLGLRGVTFRGDRKHRIGAYLAFGDLTGDGASELAMTYHFDADRTDEVVLPWSVVIARGGERLEGTISVASPGPQLSRIGTRQDSRFCELSFVEDVSGDRFGDLLINVGGDGSYLFFGREELPQSVVIEEEVSRGRATHIVLPGVEGTAQAVSPGDLTGDGIRDLVISYPEGPCGEFPEFSCGEIFILAGQVAWPERVDLSAGDSVVSRLSSSRFDEELGLRLASVGDVNDDGFGDIFIGTADYRRAYLLFGSDAFPAAVSDFESHVLSGVESCPRGLVLGRTRIVLQLDAANCLVGKLVSGTTERGINGAFIEVECSSGRLIKTNTSRKGQYCIKLREDEIPTKMTFRAPWIRGGPKAVSNPRVGQEEIYTLP